ncbi:Hypothetical protein POVR2_LOCUS234 [uncultured virus]|nr:Hypothetical protein POVR2_LOCUS234 [uncultured virus]
MYSTILLQLASWRDRTGSSIIANIQDEEQLADAFFQWAWPGHINLAAKVDSFKPSAMVWLIRNYKIDSVFDSEVGRGNRMIACITNHVKYYGVYSYLPMRETAAVVVQAFKLDPAIATLIYKPFDEVLIGEYDVQCIFLTLPATLSASQTCSKIIKAWNNLSAGSILVMYSKEFDSSLRLLTSQVMEILIGVSASSDRFYELGRGTDERLRVWKKNDQPLVNTLPSVELRGNVFQSVGMSLMYRAIPTYLRSYSNDTQLHYVCNAYVPDVVALDLAKLIPQHKLTVYVSSWTKSQQFVNSLNKSSQTVVRYNEDSGKKQDSLSIDPRDVLLPAMLEDPLFEACLIQSLRVYLPQDSGQLITFPRVWIETDYLVLIRALLTVWPRTTLLVSTNQKIDRFSNMIDLEQRGRVLLFSRQQQADTKSKNARDKSNNAASARSKSKSLKQMKDDYGYAEDAILQG